MDLGPHAAFIWGSYTAALLILAGIAVWLWRVGEGHRKTLADFERRGIKRQSER